MLKRIKGTCAITVNQSVGIAPATQATYEIIVNKCFVDLYIEFAGQGAGVYRQNIIFSVTITCCFIWYESTNGVYKYLDYIFDFYAYAYKHYRFCEMLANGSFYVVFLNKTEPVSRFSTQDVTRAGVNIRGQFWYMIADDK